MDEKAQLHTLEGVASASILLMVMIYAIDATSMTPLSASTASVHEENELGTLGQDILNMLDYTEPGYNSKLKDDVQMWDGKEYMWNGSGYLDRNDDTRSLTNNLTAILNATLVKQGVAHNVVITFLDYGTLHPETANMIYSGDPSDNAVIVYKKIVLQNVAVAGGAETEDEDSMIKDIDTQTNLYNIVDVKLVLWRM